MLRNLPKCCTLYYTTIFSLLFFHHTAELKPLVAEMVANPTEVKVVVNVEEEPTTAMEVVAELTDKQKLAKVGGIKKRKKVGRK